MKGLQSFTALLLTAVMLLTLCACGDSDTRRRDDDEEETTVTTLVGSDEDEDASKTDEDAPTAEDDEQEDADVTVEVVDKTTIVGEWKGTIVLDDWVKALIGTPTGDKNTVAMMTKLYDVMIDNITLDYYMDFNKDGTAAWKMKDTFVKDMLDILRGNAARYIAEGGVYELLATQGLDRDLADAALEALGTTADEFGNSLLVTLESGLHSAITADSVMPGGTTKDGFYIGLGEYEHEGDSVTFIGEDGTKQTFTVNLDKGTLTAKAFYLGGVAIGVNLSRV